MPGKEAFCAPCWGLGSLQVPAMPEMQPSTEHTGWMHLFSADI